MKIRVMTMFALVAALMTAPSATATPGASCDMQAIVETRVAELGETGRSVWTIAPASPNQLWGWVSGNDQVTISSAVTCDKIRTVVTHEWMHLLQGREYPGRAQRAYGHDFEVIADCGSELLGGNYMPYFEVHHGCTTANYESARHLIMKSGMAASLLR